MRLMKFKRLEDEDIYINVDEIEAVEQFKSIPESLPQTMIRLKGASKTPYVVKGKAEDIVKELEKSQLKDIFGGLMGFDEVR